MVLIRTMRVLVGDIGGTKSLLGVVELAAGAPPRLVHSDHYASAAVAGPTALFADFVPKAGAFARAAVAVAGPVAAGAAHLPNLGWTLDQASLTAELGAPALLLNDFTAVGYGLDLLGADDLLCLQVGRPVVRAPRAVLGAGTGLGQAHLYYGERGYRVYATEAGHTDFAPKNALELGLLCYLQAQVGPHVSWERVLSGSGLVSVYRYLVERTGELEAPSVSQAMRSGDPPRVITENAAADATCHKALDLFVRLYGAEAGNLALRTLARGGLYLAGGIAPRIAGQLAAGTFMEAFVDKGRFASFLRDVPVFVVTNPHVALFGAAVYAANPATDG